MKKTIAFFLSLLCLLAGCATNSGETKNATDAAGDGSQLHSTVDAETGEWTGAGGCYKLKPAAGPSDAKSVILASGQLYFTASNHTMRDNVVEINAQLQNQECTALYASDNDLILCEGTNGIWVSEYDYIDEDGYIVFRLVSSDGEELRRFTYQTRDGHSVDSMVCASGMLYLTLASRCVEVISEYGESVCVFGNSNSPCGEAVLGSDGQVYVVYDTGAGCDVSMIDTASAGAQYQFSIRDGRAFSGNTYIADSGWLFLLENDTGLYGIGPGGKETPIIIWAECNITPVYLYNVIPMEDGSYFLLFYNEAYTMLPADPAEIKPKTRLTVASVGTPEYLRSSVSSFNGSSSEYFIEIVDYSDGGAYADDQAVTRLGTEIMSGRAPDMICFASISPYAYIARGYLADLREFMDADSEISAEDIAIANALDTSGGIYYVSNTFYLETLVGQYSQFGDRFGWTLSEYLNIEKDLPQGTDMIYNMTKEIFLERIASRYIRTAVDWDAGTCDFNNSDFIEILNASTRINHNPENTNNMSFGYGPTKVGQGSRVASLSWVNSVWKLAYEVKMAGCELSFIGWPTADGRCGSDIYLNDPVGIMAHGDNRDGCWEFVKYMLTNVNPNSDDGLPVYLPSLKNKVELAKKDDDLPVKLTDADGEAFLDLVSSVENTSMYDDAIMSIIMNESGALFAGNRTAEQTAALIQSRAGLYVAEQYG